MFYDLFYDLCTRKGVSPSKACLDMGLSRSLAAKWKNTGATPSSEVILKIADYFNVSADTLLGMEQKENPAANNGRKLSIEERAEQILAGIADNKDGSLMLDGKPASQEAIDAFRQAVRMGVEYARKINDEKKK